MQVVQHDVEEHKTERDREVCGRQSSKQQCNRLQSVAVQKLPICEEGSQAVLARQPLH